MNPGVSLFLWMIVIALIGAMPLIGVPSAFLLVGLQSSLDET